MSIHFISPATLEFTGHISAWRRQPQAPSELSSLNKRQLADLRGDHFPSFVRWFRAA